MLIESILSGLSSDEKWALQAVLGVPVDLFDPERTRRQNSGPVLKLELVSKTDKCCVASDLAHLLESRVQSQRWLQNRQIVKETYAFDRARMDHHPLMVTYRARGIGLRRLFAERVVHEYEPWIVRPMAATDNQQLYALVCELMETLQTVGAASLANGLREALTFSSMPGELLGELRLALGHVREHEVYGRSDVSSKVDEGIAYICYVLGE